jgi:predicted regulator of Ras-like GTPase activity (Roadblock/LC7/MglB family)
VDAAQALADLTEISSQIEIAVLLDGQGRITGSTVDDELRSSRLAEGAKKLLAAAQEVRSEGETLTQIEAATLEGSVFVVRDGDHVIAATTSPEPTVGLVFYDLKSCLRSAAAAVATPAPKKRAPAKKKADAAP